MQLDLFRALPAAQLGNLAAVGELRVFHRGEQLLGPQDEPPPLYLILSGHVQLSRRHPALTEPLETEQLGPGDLVGATTADSGRHVPYTATALAETDVLDLSDGPARRLVVQTLRQLIKSGRATAEVRGYATCEPS